MVLKGLNHNSEKTCNARIRKRCHTSIGSDSHTASWTYGDAILAGDLTTGRLTKMGLTVVVPYLVSTFSSVGAIQRADQDRSGDETS